MLRDEDVESDIFTSLPFLSLLMIQSRNNPGHFISEKMLGWSETKGEKQVALSSAFVVQLNESPVLPTHDLIIAAAMHSPFS